MNDIRFPAEWEPHARTWMVWPHRQAMWAPELAAVQADYARIANSVARFEPVRMIADPKGAASARAQCGEGVEIVTYPVDDSWFRDTGPSFVIQDGAKAGVDWRFNAWGEKTGTWEKDAVLAERVLADLGVPRIASRLFTEGGGLNTDGQGTLLTTDTVMLNANRNPNLTRDDMDAEFARTLGIRKVISLPGNPYETGTDGHVDGIACFTAPGKVLAAVDAMADAEEAAVAQSNLDMLAEVTDAEGRKLEITLLPSARRRDVDTTENFDFCNSYINFYVCDGAVILPGYDEPADEEAREIVQAAFPDREIVQIPIPALATGGGGIHCVTQQEPA